MRVAVLSLALLAVSAVSVQAQTYDPRYPVCMKEYSGSPGGGEWIDCSYTSLPQCQASASGRAAMCEVNPYFLPGQGRSPGAHRHYRHGY
ncbi:DUF3551 domain-containing protein [Bradyrhizobium sp.]|uniref:DUF3551 domain-containing protein n=1 Tax=Bradyrhizobium sp. TaxID=376 RepID=UPI00239B0C6B|nr:DUF3551 domain-containing protein [Bradyrhizobium sp.]MDE2378199.1 DUF3551 domain-containing protein [Bradyrhizobium sp.]